MPQERKPPRQTPLPFAEGEATYAERWNDLMIALSRIGSRCDLHLKDLVQWIFRATAGGTAGTLQRSYGKLAERPLGLCCSMSKARSTVESAERLGLISVKCCRRLDGAQLYNAYAIDWEGVRRIVLGQSADVATEQPPVATGQPPVLWQHLLKEQEASIEVSQERIPVPVPEAEPFPTDLVTKPGALAAALCDGSPILAAARERRLAPLPAGGLVHGVFGPLTGLHLSKPLKLVPWHRQQLSTAMPVMGETEADLLLTIATAMYATALPESVVKRSRVGVFVFTLSRRKWEKCLPFVPAARMLLDEAIAALGPSWAGIGEVERIAK